MKAELLAQFAQVWAVPLGRVLLGILIGAVYLVTALFMHIREQSRDIAHLRLGQAAKARFPANDDYRSAL